ncbi:MFS transporter [Thiomicrorhabdus aquaedulcis]|uniref:MFS transporter n=1 Tax=Thiomicrorhabdus aquaedulcis TaxID=2211106 RepID=UPI001E5414BB|nr:MFS transporter [Thiomicrorhabdus aquaedulcis]
MHVSIGLFAFIITLLFYFSVLGALLPYLGLYLQTLQFTPVQIGQLLAVLLGTKIIAPNIWGWLADRSGHSIKWVRLATGLCLLAALGLVWFEQFWGLFFSILFFSFFWHASLPQFESYTFGCLGDDKHRYGQIRLWGSVGFIVAVLAVGWQIETFSVRVLPWDLLILLALVWLSAFLVKDTHKAPAVTQSQNFWVILRQPTVLSLLVVSFLVQLSHGVYYGFFTIHLSGLGFDKTTIAWLWALGVLAEVAVFFYMRTIFKHATVRWLILVSVALTAVRWLMNSYLADSLGWMTVAQLLHAASFGLFHAAAIHLINEHFSGAHQGKGQAVFAASSHGLGGALGMLLAGYAWAYGGAQLSYVLSALSVMLAFLIAYRWVR